MAVGNGTTASPRTAEDTPLLREQREYDGADIPEPSTRSQSRDGDQESLIDSDKANQHVGKTRGAFIMLSLWGLIFLQGMSTKTKAISTSGHR